ncbi:MAG: hypothetical protein K2H15_07750, partial [Muribaculaceae bacterium]|nr:hypothetical protein [Muribaculaceae bacterium]
LSICHTMKIRFPKYIGLLAILLFTIFSSHAAPIEAISRNEKSLSRLDSILSNHFKLVNEKEVRIEGLRKTLGRTKENDARLAITRQLFEEYQVYNSDSALFYATESRRLAENTMPDNYDLITSWKLNQAFIYTVQGLYDQTLALIGEIDPTRLSNETKGSYYETLGYLHSMRGVYLSRDKKLWEEEMKKANAYRDSIQMLQPDLSDDWLWVPISIALDRTDKDVTNLDISKLKNLVDSSSEPTRQNAINAYWLGRYYEHKGEMTEMVKYKTMAATYDALILNREIAALQELATFLFDNEELNRAYSYLIYAVNQANLYNNRFRMVSLSDILPSVRDRYRMGLEKRDHRLSVFVWLLGVLSVVLIVCIIFIILEFSKLKKTRNLLKEANNDLNASIRERDNAISDLEDANRQLQTVNTKLKETDIQKMSLLAYALKLTSENINTLEDYRKKLLKKYKANRIEEMGMLINDPELTKEHYQNFYKSFDRMVLSLFPDFAEAYNRTASDENRVNPESIKKTQTLNTRLRIFALRRLGVSKSSDIASMLNVSIRTIYNNKNNGGGSEKE